MNGKILEAYKAVHTYTCLSSGHCVDKWRHEHLVKAAELLEEMGLPFSGTSDELRDHFYGLRKSGKAPSVLQKTPRVAL